MPTTNEQLRDRAVRHAIYLERFKGGQVSRMRKFLVDMEADILGKLNQHPDQTTEWGRKRLTLMLKQTREIQQAQMGKMGQTFIDELEDLIELEAEFAVTGLDKSIPLQTSIVQPAPNLLNAAVHSKPFAGKLLKEWVKDYDAKTLREVQGAIKQGVAQGETIRQITGRLKAATGKNTKGMTAMARTAVNHVTTTAREEIYKENSSVIKKVQWVSTLDGRTSLICMGLDGKVFPIGSGDRPPAHPNCRSTTIPVTHAAQFIDPNATPAQRASMNGAVPAKMNYEAWLKTQPEAFQREVLGPGRFKLWKSGQIKLDKFTDPRGTVIGIDKLRAKSGIKPKAKPKPKPKAPAKPKPAAPANRITPTYETEAGRKAYKRYYDTQPDRWQNATALAAKFSRGGQIRHLEPIFQKNGKAKGAFNRGDQIHMGATYTRAEGLPLNSKEAVHARATAIHETGHLVDGRIASVIEHKLGRQLDFDEKYGTDGVQHPLMDKIKDATGFEVGTGDHGIKASFSKGYREAFAKDQKIVKFHTASKPRRIKDDKAMFNAWADFDKLDIVTDSKERRAILTQMLDDVGLTLDEAVSAMRKNNMYSIYYENIDFADLSHQHMASLEQRIFSLAYGLKTKSARWINKGYKGGSFNAGELGANIDGGGIGGNMSDLFGAITNKKIEGGYSHEAAYFKRKGAKEVEAFAEVYSILEDADPVMLKILDTFFPEQVAYMEDLMTKLSKYALEIEKAGTWPKT
jgi:SPP1 gp7 family putative phage head morphogenesis protein